MKYVEIALADTGVIIFNAFGKQFDVQDDFTTSTISFSIPRDDPQASSCVAGTFLKVTIDGTTLDSYFVLSGDSTDYVTEDGVPATQVQGNSIHSVFEDAPILPSAWPNPVPSGHDFQNATPGTIIKTLVSRSQERSFLTKITTDTFSGTHDSNGVTWPSMLDRSYTTGDNTLSVIQSLIDQGIVDAKIVGYDLRVYVYGTLDKTLSPDTVVFRVGQNCTEGGVQTDASDFYTDIFAIGDGDAVAMKTRPASYNVIGRRRMRFAQYAGITDSNLLGVLADLELDQYNHIKSEHSLAVSPYFYTPFVDYNIHNLVAFDKGDGSLENIRIKQISVTQNDDDGSFTIGVTLGDLLEDADAKLKRRVDAITGVNAGGGAVPSDKTDDKLAPAAPSSVTISTLDYIDNSNNRKIGAIVDWPDVNTNSDGTPASDIDHYEAQFRTGTSTPTGSPTTLIPARSDSTWSSVFDRRGKSGAQIISGVVSGSTRLPNGTDLWVMNSAYRGTPSGDSATGVTKVPNAFVVTSPSDLTQYTQYLGASNGPLISASDLGVTPESGFVLSDYTAVIGGPFQANGKVYTVVSLQRNSVTGNSSAQVVRSGMWVAQWNPTTLVREALTSVGPAVSIAATDAVYVEGLYAYVYGHTSASVSSRYLGRILLSSPFSAPTWNDGAGNWTNASVVAASPISGVKKIGTTYYALITGSSSTIRQMTAPNLWGPWNTTVGNVYVAPEAVGGRVVTAPTFHPQFDSSNGMEMAYSIIPSSTPTTSIYLSETKAIRGPGATFLPVGLDTADWSTIASSDVSKIAYMGRVPMSSFQVQVRTVDTSGLVSSWTQSSQTVLKGTEGAVLVRPSAPTGFALFQGAQIYWNGVDVNGNAPNGDWANVELHVSDQSASFIPGEATRVFSWQIISNQPQVWSAGVTGLQTEHTYWARLVVQGKAGTYSDPSDALSFTTMKLNDVDLPSDITQAAADLTGVKSDLAQAQSDITNVQDDIATVETNLSTTNSNLATTNTALSQAQADISTNKTNITSVTNDLSTTKATLTSTNTALSQAQADISTNKTNITSVTNDLSTTKATLTSTNTTLGQVQTDLSNTKTTLTQTVADVANKGRVWYQTTPPSPASSTDLWIDITNNANTPKRWNGTTWVVATDKVATDAAAAAAAASSESLSRGADLVTNGTGFLGTNRNFSGLLYNSADAPPGMPASFLSAGTGYRQVFSDDFIPVDPTRKYSMSCWARETVSTGASKFYAGFTCYDSTGATILPYHYYYRPNTNTTLASAVNPGDTVINVTSGTGWTTTYGYLLAWNYLDQNGRVWPPGTYSRWVGAISSISGNTITLSSGWTGPALPAGAPVVNSQAGGNYSYAIASNQTAPTVWTKFTSSTVTGITDGTTSVATNNFAPGTAKIKILFLVQYTGSAADARQAFGGISMSEAGAAQSTADVAMTTASGKNAITWSLNDAPPTAPGTKAGDIYYKYQMVSGKTTILAMWTSDGTNWKSGALSETYLPQVNIGTGTYGELSGARLTANTVNANTVIVSSSIGTTLIADGAITTSKVTANAITATQIASNAITADKISAGVITGDKLVANTITGDKIAANTITATQIAANSITGDRISGNTITAGNIAGLTITGDKLVANTITGDKIAANTITAANIFGNTITGDKISGNTITAGNIAGLTITGDKIAANAITADKIAANTITGDRISGNTITGDKISGNTITAANIAGLTITGDKIAANAITADKITGNTITGDKIAGLTITGDKIFGNTIGAGQINANSVAAAVGQFVQVKADNIQAGNIQAQIGMTAAASVIAGNPIAACAGLWGSDGSIRSYKFSNDGIQYLSTSLGGSTLDQLQIYNDSSSPAVASINSIGDIYGNTLSSKGDITVAGGPLIGSQLDPTTTGLVDNLAWGCVAQANFKSLVNGITIPVGTTTAIGQFSVSLNPNRSYQLVMHWRGYSALSPGSYDNVTVRFYRTNATDSVSDAPNPTATQSLAIGQQSQNFAVTATGIDDQLIINFQTGDPSGQLLPVQYKFLLGLYANGNAFSPDITNVDTPDNWVATISDIGPIPKPTLVTAPGAPPKKTYVTSWSASDSKSWNDQGTVYQPSGSLVTTSFIRQGLVNGRQWFGAFSCASSAASGDDGKTIAQALTGATLTKAEVYVPVTWLGDSSGGIIELRPLGANAVPSTMTLPAVSSNIVKKTVPSVGDYWVTVPISWFSSSNNGIIIAAPDNTTSLTNCQIGGATYTERVFGTGSPGSTVPDPPQVRLTYTR